MSKDFSKCFCEGVEFQTYAHVVGMKKPFDEGWDKEVVPIDVCIATEIGELWHKGVVTLNSCCGHGKVRSSVVVDKASDKRMRKLGYSDGMQLENGLPCFYLNTGTLEKSTAWRSEDYGTYWEVIPVDDSRMHLAGDECWCNPETLEDERPIISHRALDGRTTGKGFSTSLSPQKRGEPNDDH